MATTSRKRVDIDLKLNFLTAGAQPPARVSGARAKYEGFLQGLKKRKGEWVCAASAPKGTPSGPFYARRSTIASFEGYSAQVRQLPADVSHLPGVPKEHALGVGLFAMCGSVPKQGKTEKK